MAEPSDMVQEIIRAYDPRTRRSPPWCLLAWYLGAAKQWKRRAPRDLLRRHENMHRDAPTVVLWWIVNEPQHGRDTPGRCVLSFLWFGAPGTDPEYHRRKRSERWLVALADRYGDKAVERMAPNGRSLRELAQAAQFMEGA